VDNALVVNAVDGGSETTPEIERHVERDRATVVLVQLQRVLNANLGDDDEVAEAGIVRLGNGSDAVHLKRCRDDRVAREAATCQKLIGHLFIRLHKMPGVQLFHSPSPPGPLK